MLEGSRVRSVFCVVLCTKPVSSSFCFSFPRYQPEQPNLAYQMARTTEETDNNESVSTSESQTGFLPEEEEKCSLKAILCPPNSDPSKFSGLVVNISTCIIGKYQAMWLWGSELAGRSFCSPWWGSSPPCLLRIACNFNEIWGSTGSNEDFKRNIQIRYVRLCRGKGICNFLFYSSVCFAFRFCFACLWFGFSFPLAKKNIKNKALVSLWCLFTGFLIVGSCVLTTLKPSTLIKAVWIIAAILVLIISFIVWKQPESKTKLSFKVSVPGGEDRNDFWRWLEVEMHIESASIRWRGTWPKGHRECRCEDVSRSTPWE